jgi:c-di-GMP-binding flagellar brake protein YcgR
MIETPMKPAVHDRVLVEADVDGELVGFRAVVVNVADDALWLGMPRPDSRLARLSAGEPITLTLRAPEGGLVAESVFLEHLRPTRTRLFAVQMPSEIRLTQRRVHMRFETECPIQYTIVSQSDSGGAGLTGRGITLNIGTGGLEFVVEAPIEDTVIVGDALEIALGLGRDAIAGEADVLRIADATDVDADGRPVAPASLPRPPRTIVAVGFTSISEAAQDMIVRYIFALQRARR